MLKTENFFSKIKNKARMPTLAIPSKLSTTSPGKAISQEKQRQQQHQQNIQIGKKKVKWSVCS